MNKYKIIAICGKSASGKDTLMKEILKQDSSLNEIISFTTRPPREGEVDGVNYHFLSNEEFAKQIESGEMIEATAFRDWCYGTSLKALDKNKINIGVFNVDGIDILYDTPCVDLYVVLVETPAKERLIRSLNRESNPDVEEIIRRYQADEEDFEYFYGQNATLYNMDGNDIIDSARGVLDLALEYWSLGKID